MSRFPYVEVDAVADFYAGRRGLLVRLQPIFDATFDSANLQHTSAAVRPVIQAHFEEVVTVGHFGVENLRLVGGAFVRFEILRAGIVEHLKQHALDRLAAFLVRFQLLCKGFLARLYVAVDLQRLGDQLIRFERRHSLPAFTMRNKMPCCDSLFSNRRNISRSIACETSCTTVTGYF